MRRARAVAIVMAANAVGALGFAPSAGAGVDGEFVTNEARDIRCVLKDGRVSCQADFTGAPVEGARILSIVSTDMLSGSLTWSEGNLASGEANPVADDTVLTNGRMYRIDGWTIVSTPAGIRFTDDDGTPTGMNVSLEKVTVF